MINKKNLNTPYCLSDENISFFKKNKYIKLKNVFEKDIILYFNKVVSEAVESINTIKVPIEKRDTYGKAFLQLFNLWKESEEVKSLIFSKRLSQIATELMEVSGVRLYHDQALFKEKGGGITPWHADQYYWPLETDKTITAWIPLQETPKNMGPLEFSAGSHKINEGRELSISDESEKVIHEKLRVTDFNHIIEPFDIGEVSFHSGWVFHRAGANKSNQIRKVMTIIYMDSKMKLKKPENDGQQNDWKTWCPNAKIGQIINSPLNPILHER
tara:strand:- start:9491 stop:10303 length:813 start_codon:yes stop_codon:yes gene_type:complete